MKDIRNVPFKTLTASWTLNWAPPLFEKAAAVAFTLKTSPFRNLLDISFFALYASLKHGIPSKRREFLIGHMRSFSIYCEFSFT